MLLSEALSNASRRVVKVKNELQYTEEDYNFEATHIGS